VTRRTIAPLLIAALLALALPATAAAKSTITMSGSTSVFPLVKQLATNYVKQNRGAAAFRLLQGGSDIGINDVARGRVTFGMASRDPQRSDPGGLVFNRIARDGVCVVTHPRNPLPNISRATVQAIFSGRIRNWSAVPGARAKGPIDLITRTPSSGTADAFQSIFMGLDLRVAGNASPKATNGLASQAVRSNPAAIGYLDFTFTAGTAVAPYQGVPCNLRNAKSGQYGGVRNLWLVSRGRPSGAAAQFLRWTTGARGQRIVANGWVSLR
jgi:phosphate transport system substrate-binding protein